MTAILWTTDSNAEFNFAEAGDTLDVLSFGGIAVAGADAIDTAFGQANLIVAGSVIGFDGFVDTSKKGADMVNVAQSGAVVGYSGSGLSIAASGTHVNNVGIIEAYMGAAIKAGAANTIVNQGQIDGATFAISDKGSDGIHNTGTISARTATDSTIFEAAGMNTIFNSGLIDSTGGLAAIDLVGGGDTVTNAVSGSIEGADDGLLIAGGKNYVSNSGLISGAVAAIDITGTVGSTLIRNSGVIEAASAGGTAVEFLDAGAGDSLTNTGTIVGNVIFDGANATLINSGVINGAVTFNANGAVVQDGGPISGTITLTGNNDTFNETAAGDGGALCLTGDDCCINSACDDFTLNECGTPANLKTDTIAAAGMNDDVFAFTLSETVTTADLKRVNGFSRFVLVSGDQIAITEGIADTAYHDTLTIDAVGNDSVNLAGVTSTTDKITVWGSGGGNTITAGASLDTFAFKHAADFHGRALRYDFGRQFRPRHIRHYDLRQCGHRDKHRRYRGRPVNLDIRRQSGGRSGPRQTRRQ